MAVLHAQGQPRGMQPCGIVDHYLIDDLKSSALKLGDSHGKTGPQ
jgi:hypothetical protein